MDKLLRMIAQPDSGHVEINYDDPVWRDHEFVDNKTLTVVSSTDIDMDLLHDHFNTERLSLVFIGDVGEDQRELTDESLRIEARGRRLSLDPTRMKYLSLHKMDFVDLRRHDDRPIRLTHLSIWFTSVNISDDVFSHLVYLNVDANDWNQIFRSREMKIRSLTIRYPDGPSRIDVPPSVRMLTVYSLRGFYPIQIHGPHLRSLRLSRALSAHPHVDLIDTYPDDIVMEPGRSAVSIRFVGSQNLRYETNERVIDGVKVAATVMKRV